MSESTGGPRGPSIDLIHRASVSLSSTDIIRSLYTFLMMQMIAVVVLLVSCTQDLAKTTRYDRKAYPHWSDVDKDCQNTRQELLISRSLSQVGMNRKGCTVVRGKWDDYYYPQVHTQAKSVDIDHLIPLKHAHDLGASLWGRAQREAFANDPENLVITDRRYNREKGAKTIAQWLPVGKDYACRYIRDWVRLKSKYQLPLTPPEENTIRMSGCR